MEDALVDYTILVVEDSAPMRQLISYTLKGAGYQVIEALDGKDAINKIEGKQIDLVISDLNMPNINGLELLKYLRDHDSFKSTPVVMLTTESQFSKVVEAKQSGINAWIIKPFEASRLIDTVKNLLP